MRRGYSTELLPPPEPWSLPPFEPVHLTGLQADHAFCVCLFHEPQYGQHLAHYDFSARYLRAGPIRTFLQHWGAQCILFADEVMLPLALSMELGDVYLVQRPPRVPWSQHLYRYYATLLPEERRAPCLHFRGLDNVDRDDMPALHRWAESGWDVLRAPYLRGRTYYPVRGSVSLAGAGITTLADTLHSLPPVPAHSWPAAFHVDERHLSRWWKLHHRQLNVCTLIDVPRVLPRAAVETERALRSGARAELRCAISQRDGPLRSPRPPLSIDYSIAETPHDL